MSLLGAALSDKMLTSDSDPGKDARTSRLLQDVRDSDEEKQRDWHAIVIPFILFMYLLLVHLGAFVQLRHLQLG